MDQVSIDSILRFLKAKPNYDALDNSKFKENKYKCEISDLLIDSFTRIINDENKNIVTSCQFFATQNQEQNIKLINISANHIDNQLINRSKKLINNVQGFEGFSKHPSQYIFNFYSIERLQSLTQIVGYLTKMIKNLFHKNKIIGEEYKVCFKNISKAQNDCVKKFVKFNVLHRNSSEKIEKESINLLNTFSEFIYEIFYIKNNFRIEFDQNLKKKEFVYNFFIFLQSIWDVYSFHTISKQYFDLTSVTKLYFDDTCVSLCNQTYNVNNFKEENANNFLVCIKII